MARSASPTGNLSKGVYRNEGMHTIAIVAYAVVDREVESGWLSLPKRAQDPELRAFRSPFTAVQPLRRLLKIFFYFCFQMRQLVSVQSIPGQAGGVAGALRPGSAGYGIAGCYVSSAGKRVPQTFTWLPLQRKLAPVAEACTVRLRDTAARRSLAVTHALMGCQGGRRKPLEGPIRVPRC